MSDKSVKEVQAEELGSLLGLWVRAGTIRRAPRCHCSPRNREECLCSSIGVSSIPSLLGRVFYTHYLEAFQPVLIGFGRGA